MHRHRNSKIKIEHTILPGIFDLLLKIVEKPYVKSIIPGRIKKAKVSSPPTIDITVRTENGVKMIARSGKAVQEIFVVIEKMNT